MLNMSELPSPSLPEISAMPKPEPIVTQNIAPEPHPAQRGGKRILLIGGAAVVGIGALCGLGYAAWAGYLPNPLMKRPTPEQLFAALIAINSAKTTIDVHFSLGEREEGVEPLDFSIFEEQTGEEDESSIPTLTSAAQILPSDLDLNLSITSSVAKGDKTADQETHFAGTYTGNNISANIDLTVRTVEGVTYVKPDAIPLPIPIFDMNALEGKWISFGEEAKDREIFNYIALSEEETVEEKEETPVNLDIELFALLKQGAEDGAIIFSVPERITYSETRAWYTEAVIDGEKLRETIISMGENREALFPEITEYTLFTDDFLESSRKERAKDIYREIFKRTELSATINDDGSPLMIALATRLAPKFARENNLTDRQITLETKIHFNDINAPVNLTAPEDAISTKEALSLLLGRSAEENIANKQKESVSDLRSALTLYQTENGTYPETLEELIGTENGFKEVVQIPLDLLTEQAYVYERTESGYTLRYTMPETTEDIFSGYDLAVEGINTATELLFSEEGAKLTDEDEDGISLYDETVTYGTSDYSEDSDGDGYGDKIEIDGGYNPAGEGALLVEE